MAMSILSDERECFFCHTLYNLHKHHIYEGINRKKSEEHGFWVYLCGRHHNLSDRSVHMNEQINRALKAFCQKQFEKTHTREEFMKIIGRNYLE